MAAQVEKLLEEIEALKQENQRLKMMLYKKPNPTALQKVQQAIEEKATELIDMDPLENPRGFKRRKTVLKRRITDDLKWELRLRYINQISDAHVERAMEFVRNWTDERDV